MKAMRSAVVLVLILSIVGQSGAAWADPYVYIPLAPEEARSAPPPLRAAIRDFEGARFTEGVQALQEFLAQPDLAVEVRIQAMAYLAFCHIGLNDEEKAKELFAQILDLRPDCRLREGLSPRINDVFQSALDAWQAAHPPAPPPHKAGTPIWLIILGLGLLGGLLGARGGGGGGGGPAGTSGIAVTVH